MDSPLDQFEALYAKLSPSEQREHYMRLVHQFTAGPADALTDVEDLLYGGLREIIGAHMAPPGVLLKSYGKARFAADAERLASFIEAATRGALLRKPVRITLAARIIDCLDKHTKKWRQGTGPSSILNMMAYLEDAVDAAYPGYAQAGMLHRIVPGANAKRPVKK